MNQLNKLVLTLLALSVFPAYAGSLWHAHADNNAQHMRSAAGSHTLTYSLDESALKASLAAFKAKNATHILELPLPDGTMRTFRVWENNLLPAELAARYPEVRTYNAEATDNPAVTAKIDFTVTGFHAMVYDGDKTSFINPLDNTAGTGEYIVTYKREEAISTQSRNACQTIAPTGAPSVKAGATASRTIGGYQLRTYRIAISCDHQYAIAATGVPTPSKAGVLSYIATTMNRVNGVYERELSITMTLVPREDTLIYISATGDPFGSNDSNPYPLMTLNQKMCDSLIGTANYDIGHIFSTGAGGLSQVGCACNATIKAQSVTGNSQPKGDGFDIDYVAHEIGHEFGADHTFNNGASEACGNGNANQPTAYEPGSGSTIMAYAGICSPDNIQKHSDAYFTIESLLQIYSFVTNNGTCASLTPTNNKPPALDSFTRTYAIPYLTPFELTAPMAVDSVADTLTTYCWEQRNLGDFGLTLSNTEQSGPLFRSFMPDTSRTRVFPNIEMVLAYIKSNAGTNNAEGEKLPTVARVLSFKLTTRSILNGVGCFLFPDDSIHLDAINTGAGFAVTSQNTGDLVYIGGSIQTVTWDVVHTTEAPISTPEVDIYLSADGGYHWNTYLGRFPNNGSAVITLPSPATTISSARIKVKGAGNVFFNVGRSNFAIVADPGVNGDILLFPVPGKNDITVITGDKGNVSTAIYNSAGRLAWRGDINGILKMDVSMWPRDVYAVRMIDVKGVTTIKRFVLE